MRVAVIPARGGSKRIPRKNIREFAGLPMIAWSIRAAIDSGCFEEIVVSTDDDEIAEVAKASGANVPFIRPEILSDDHTSTNPVVSHAIVSLAKQGLDPTEVCCIYATAPFIRGSDICSAYELLRAEPVDYVFAITAFPSPIQRALRVEEDGRVSMFDPASFYKRSQDLEPAYHDAAQFYWGTAQAWLNELPAYTARSLGFVLPSYRVQDLDTLEDWRHAEVKAYALNDHEADGEHE